MGSGCVIGIPSALCARKSGPLRLSGLTRGRDGANVNQRSPEDRLPPTRPINRVARGRNRVARPPELSKCASVGSCVMCRVAQLPRIMHVHAHNHIMRASGHIREFTGTSCPSVLIQSGNGAPMEIENGPRRTIAPRARERSVGCRAGRGLRRQVRLGGVRDVRRGRWRRRLSVGGLGHRRGRIAVRWRLCGVIRHTGGVWWRAR
jgi:hypothetical protein